MDKWMGAGTVCEAAVSSAPGPQMLRDTHRSKDGALSLFTGLGSGKGSVSGWEAMQTCNALQLLCLSQPEEGPSGTVSLHCS
mmetsp:Transcript_20326/g.61245  ORF Transcript_20326/g.61245 Transcript_20326/m.61245 type:complete len:82 (-) Transcript_20326:439-684(-)